MSISSIGSSFSTAPVLNPVSTPPTIVGGTDSTISALQSGADYVSSASTIAGGTASSLSVQQSGAVYVPSTPTIVGGTD